MFPTLGCCKMGHFARLVLRTWEISRKLRGTEVRSVRYYRCQYDRCQRFAARSDKTSFEVNVWPPSSQMRCPRRLLSCLLLARTRSLVRPLVVCCERTTTCCLPCSRRRNLPAQDSSRESSPIPAKCSFR